MFKRGISLLDDFLLSIDQDRHLAGEKMSRIHEMEDLNAKLNAEKNDSHKNIDRETKELRTRLEQVAIALKSQLEESTKELETKIENNYDQIYKLNHDLENAKNELFEKIHLEKEECAHEYQQIGDYFRY